MCIPVNHIKLCTCGEVEPKQNKTWRLVRGSTQIAVVGNFLPPSGRPVEFNIGAYLESKIETDLNNFDVFDFEYKPEENDTLTIWLHNREYHFVVVGGEYRSIPKYWFLDGGTVASAGKVKLINW